MSAPFQTPHPTAPPEFGEHTESASRVSRLRAALEAAARDNAQLQRELSFARAENERLRARVRGADSLRGREERRRMLHEPWSMNP